MSDLPNTDLGKLVCIAGRSAQFVFQNNQNVDILVLRIFVSTWIILSRFIICPTVQGWKVLLKSSNPPFTASFSLTTSASTFVLATLNVLIVFFRTQFSKSTPGSFLMVFVCTKMMYVLRSHEMSNEKKEVDIAGTSSFIRRFLLYSCGLGSLFRFLFLRSRS